MSGLIGALLGGVAGCAQPALSPTRISVHVALAPSPTERYCAWFGDARGNTLYVGQSAFWAASRAGGETPGANPRADLAQEGPKLVGRFDLQNEGWLEPLDVGKPGDRSGVWDVLAHPNGRIYFTSYFEPAGWVEPETGAVRLLPELGAGLNELALAGDGRVVISRYPAPEGGAGAIVIIEEEGALLAEYPLPAPAGYAAAPKTVAVDPQRGEIWVAMDLLPTDPDVDGILHDAYVLDATGEVLRTIPRPEIQFVAFAPDGTGYRAEVDAGELALRIVPPGAGAEHLDAGRRVLLAPEFPAALDFAQEVRPLPDGGALVTRWSGWVHVVEASGAVQSLRLPTLDPHGLYYTAALREGRICVTYCADVHVVCADAS
jgi:hypothetical protein